MRSILEQDSEQGSGRSSCLIEELGGVVMGGYSRALLQPVRKACCVDAGLVVPSKSPLFMLDGVRGIGFSISIAEEIWTFHFSET